MKTLVTSTPPSNDPWCKSRAIDDAVQNYSSPFRAVLLDENVEISKIETIVRVQIYSDQSLCASEAPGSLIHTPHIHTDIDVSRER